MKIHLAYLCHYNDRNDYYLSLMPVGTISIASYVESKGVDVSIANYSKAGYKKAVKIISNKNPDYLGLSLFSFNRVDTLKLVREIRKKSPHIKIILGGPHAAFLSKDILKRYPQVDYIIAGEGEKAFYDLIISLEKGETPLQVITAQRMKELDNLPHVSSFKGDAYGVDKNEQYKNIITTRGCPHKCTYCSSPAFWNRKVSFRSAENILSEIEYLHDKFGIIYFSIRDDNFTLKKERVIKFSRLLAESKINIMWNCQSRIDTIDEDMLFEMKRAGLEHIQYGVESGSQRILDLYDKSLDIESIHKIAETTRKVGVYLSFYLMTGMIGETQKDVERTISLIRKTLPGDGVVSPVSYYPGTELYHTMVKKGEIDDSVWFTSKESGIYLRDDKAVGIWMQKLLRELGMIRTKSWYRAKDYKRFRNSENDTLWVTDLLEGDYFFDEDQFDRAERCYLESLKKDEENIWPNIRLGKLNFNISGFDKAEFYYKKACDIVPNYYGAWLKLSEVQIAMGNRAVAKESIKKAYSLNSFDRRIQDIMKLLNI